METEEQSQTKTPGLEDFLENNKLTVGVFVLGVILLGAGVLGFKIFEFSANRPKVEILGTAEDGKWKREGKREGGTEENKTVEKMTVEAAGEVVKPGVYKLGVGSRVNDLLIAAGGLSANADRDWVAKNLNMAAKLQDGVKIYIPSTVEVGDGKLEAGSEDVKLDKININTASAAELDTLWGVGPATAKKIIDGRPYQKPEDLLEKKIVNKNVWEKIKDKITIY